MAQLILMRHGESIWNKKNLFTGWVDVPLSPKGIEEAFEGGRRIADIPIDRVYTSSLIRAQMTTMLALSCHHSKKSPVIIHRGEGRLEEWAKIHNPSMEKEVIPVYEAWELNERAYGDLQGLNKQESRERFGAEQVLLWRRSYRTPPPNGESLELTAKRTLPYFREEILPHLEAGETILISAHGNSLRSIVMEIEKLSEDEVIQLEIATGEPILYAYEQGEFRRDEKALSR